MPDTETTIPPSTPEDAENPPGEDGRFDLAYVTRLREEAASRRVSEKAATEALTAATGRGDALAARLLNLEIAEATRAVLADPTDLLANVDEANLVDEDGNPSADLIKAAALKLAEAKRHLAYRPGPVGDVDQGARPLGPPAFDFAEVLRRAAN